MEAKRRLRRTRQRRNVGGDADTLSLGASCDLPPPPYERWLSKVSASKPRCCRKAAMPSGRRK
eukprot:679787-Pleurochrysis_carterae.AAC.1